MKLPPLIQWTGGAGVQVGQASPPANFLKAARDGGPTQEPPRAAVLHKTISKLKTGNWLLATGCYHIFPLPARGGG